MAAFIVPFLCAIALPNFSAQEPISFPRSPPDAPLPEPGIPDAPPGSAARVPGAAPLGAAAAGLVVLGTDRGKWFGWGTFFSVDVLWLATNLPMFAGCLVSLRRT